MHCKSYSHFFSKKFQHICVSLDLNFNESLTNDVVSFEQLGPGHFYPDSLALVAQSDVNLTGNQVRGFMLIGSGNILSWILIMKHFLRTFSSSADSRRAVVSSWRKNVHRY